MMRVSRTCPQTPEKRISEAAGHSARHLDFDSSSNRADIGFV